MSATSEPRLVDVRLRREARLDALSVRLELELRPAPASEEARRIVEAGKVDAVFDAPWHAYPQAMLDEAQSMEAALAVADA